MWLPDGQEFTTLNSSQKCKLPIVTICSTHTHTHTHTHTDTHTHTHTHTHTEVVSECPLMKYLSDALTGDNVSVKVAATR